MAARLDAVQNWAESFTADEPAFTIELQEALVGDGRRPVLVVSWLTDVLRRDNHHLARFRLYNIAVPTYPYNLDVIFELECTEDQASRLLGGPRKWLGPALAVVAQISDVRKAAISIEPWASGVDPQDTRIEIGAPDLFLATGTILDLMGYPFDSGDPKM